MPSPRISPSGPPYDDHSDRIWPNRWTDLLGSIDQAAAAAALTFQAVRNTSAMLYFMRRDQDDAFTLRYQMPHGWAGDEVHPHMHVLATSPSTGNVVIDGYYFWSAPNSGIVIPNVAGWTPFRVVQTITAAQQFQEVIVPLFHTSPPVAAQKPSANLQIFVRRPGSSDPADTYEGNNPDGLASANLGLLFVDTHYQVQTFGSIPEY